jgi:hypothetical protein
LRENIRVLLLSSKNFTLVEADHQLVKEQLSGVQRIGLALSATLCIDSLVSHFSKFLKKLKFSTNQKSIRTKWDNEFLEVMRESLSLVQSEHNQFENSKLLKNHENSYELHKVVIEIVHSVEMRKLHGTQYLLCGTVCNALGGKCLENLEVFVFSPSSNCDFC